MDENYRERELEVLNYLRNNLTDPLTRGTIKTDLFDGDGIKVTFTLTELQVKNVISVEVDGDNRYIGHNYYIDLGEGNLPSTITFRTPPPIGTDNVEVVYKTGESMIYEGFQRNDSLTPRISMVSMGGSFEMVSIGEDGVYGGDKQVYYNANYSFEIRSKYAKQMKNLTVELGKLLNRYRQLNPQPYKTIISRVLYTQPFDFDNELRVYRSRITFEIKWITKF
jgi:hypothetical protein